MKRLSLLAVAALFAFPLPAYAQDAPLDTYGGAGGVLDETVQDEGGPGGTTDDQGGPGGVRGESVGGEGNVRGVTTDTGAGDAGGTLPFTGADITLMLLGGLALLGVGIGMRRAARTPA